MARSSALAFTLIELLTTIAIIALLATLIVLASAKWKRGAQRAECAHTMKGLLIADLAYFADNGEMPPVDGLVPSSIKPEHLAILARYLHTEVPAGRPGSWPKRAKQPRWMNCPAARESGYAEGATLGGGAYTGYVYLGGIEDSIMVTRGMAKLTDPEHNAHRKGIRRGVVWADVLAEFRIGEGRRFECFHVDAKQRYEDFRFSEREIEGINRAWSDGSVEWVRREDLRLLDKPNPSLQVEHMLGNYYY